jgi:hypothetical protein
MISSLGQLTRFQVREVAGKASPLIDLEQQSVILTQVSEA